MGSCLKGGFLLDANHLGSAVTRNSPVRLRIEEARIAGARFGTCIPVLCEVEAGIQQVRRPDEYRENLRRLFRYVSIWTRARLASTARFTKSFAKRDESFLR